MDEKMEIHAGRVCACNIILEFIITIILLFILSVLLSTTNLDENIMKPGIIAIVTFSVLLGSFISAKKIKSKGIVIGVLQGFIYMFILYLISSIVTKDFSLGLESFIMIGIAVFGGVVGGIIGVNLK